MVSNLCDRNLDIWNLDMTKGEISKQKTNKQTNKKNKLTNQLTEIILFATTKLEEAI